jgi:hypothetical protein
MPQVLAAMLRPDAPIVPYEVRVLQIAIAEALGDIVIGDDRWVYYTTLSVARRLHDMGCRAPNPVLA